MYISIDMDQMRFLHKHEDIKVITNLVFLEAPPCAHHVDIIPIDSIWLLKDTTETQLQILYRNTTLEEHVPYHGAALRLMLIELAQRVPASDVVAWEVEAQASGVEARYKDGLEGVVYVKGSTVVTQPGTLFKPLHLTGTIDHSAAQRIAQHALATPTTGNAPPREGSVRDTIWRVADALWEADGKPTAKDEVLHLRKKIMDLLEREHQVKRTSSSNELGKWAKSRI